MVVSKHAFGVLAWVSIKLPIKPVVIYLLGVVNALSFKKTAIVRDVPRPGETRCPHPALAFYPAL